MIDVTHIPEPNADDWWSYNGNEIDGTMDHVRSFGLTHGDTLWVRTYGGHPLRVFVINDLGVLEYQGEVSGS